MFNINFIYFIYFLPIFITFISSFATIVINYFNSVKNIIFSKNKKNIHTLPNFESNVINLSQYSVLFFYVGFLFFHLKSYNNSINLNFIMESSHFMVFYFLILLYNIVIYLLNNKTINIKNIIDYNSYISLFFILILFVMLFINNFFFFFFFVELLSYIFYLQFLQVFNKLKTNNPKNYYIDALIIFYWVNFFGSIFLILSIITVFMNFGTTTFSELAYFLNYSNKFNIFTCLFLLGFSIKLGVSGFHFLKIEIYKNMKIDSIINFSFLSTFGYLILINNVISNIAIFYNFIYFLIFVNVLFIVFLFQNNNLKNIVVFFGYSAILNSVLSLFFII